jgi:hypothetical protein
MGRSAIRWATAAIVTVLAVAIATLLAPLNRPQRVVAVAPDDPPPFGSNGWPMPVDAPPRAPPPPSAIGSARSFSGASAASLRPGRSVWAPGHAANGPVGIVIDLGRQMAYVYRAGTLIGLSSISSGRRHHETPTGRFPILEKAVWHRSTIYSGAPMPWMERLTWGGVALHAGGVPGYRQSHGCVHLPAPFARALFRVTRVGSEVRVVRSWTGTPITAPPLVLARATLPSTAQSAASMLAAAL